jgi:hypothetical protein
MISPLWGESRSFSVLSVSHVCCSGELFELDIPRMAFIGNQSGFYLSFLTKAVV